MSELENLSNDELRVQLLKFGFANMPVTQTTRKVLLKKLKVAVEMQKSKTRRETVAVMKASDEDDEPLSELIRSKKEKTPNRRATAGVIERTKKVPATTTSRNGVETPPKTKSPSRRSSRATPSKDKPIVSSSAYSLLDQSDEDVIEIIEPPAVLARRSKSKTPTTLSKSETVRVSHYAPNVRNIPIVREEDTSTEEEEKSFEVEFQQPAPILTSRRTTTALSYNNRPPIKNLTPTKYGLTTNFQSSYIPSANYSLSNQQDDDDDDDVDDAEELNAPYLSNFAKRLSTLKAEPLDAGMKKYKMNTDYNYGRNVAVPSTSTYRYSSSQYNPPLGVLQGKRESVLNNMAREFDKMDKKFSVRTYIYACLIVMIIVAIYVILFT